MGIQWGGLAAGCVGALVGAAAGPAGMAVGAGIGQFLGATLFDHTGWKKAAVEGGITGLGVGLGAAAGGALAGKVESMALERVLGREAEEVLRTGAFQKGVVGKTMDALAKDAIAGNPPVLPAAMRLFGGLMVPPAATAAYATNDELTAAHGTWIGGPGELANRIPASRGQGFLFQPAAMPEELRPWYARLATLLRKIWDNFGQAGEGSAVPRVTIPAQVDAVPMVSGVGASFYQSTSNQLHNALTRFVAKENTLAANVTTTRRAIDDGRQGVLELVGHINREIPHGDGHPGHYTFWIATAVDDATAILDSTLATVDSSARGTRQSAPRYNQAKAATTSASVPAVRVGSMTGANNGE